MKEKWYKVLLKTLTTIIFIICGLALLISLVIIIKSKANPDEVPDIFGYKPMIVLSGSMETKIHAGDLAIVKEVEPSTLKVDDVIAFRTSDGTITTHRIVKISVVDGKTKFITKGDNNNTEDDFFVEYEDIEGKYKFRLSGFGNIFMFIQKPLGLAVTLLVILVVGLTVLYLFGGNKKISNNELKEFEEYKKLKEKNKM